MHPHSRWAIGSIALKATLIASLIGGTLARGVAPILAQTSDGPPQQPPTSTQPPPPTGRAQVPVVRTPPPTHGHPGDSETGRQPHGGGGGNGAAIGGAVAGAGAALLIGELLAHRDNSSPEKLEKDGPQVPKQFGMNNFVVKGLAGPNWPVVLDFALDTPGAVVVDVIAADKHHHYQATMRNDANHRAYGIFRLPPDFGTKVQTAAYQVRSAATGSGTAVAAAAGTAGGSGAVPRLRTYGLGAGEKAVGSVAIDQLAFGPASIHPAVKEVANYGFHAHSAFDGVRAEFLYTTLENGGIVVERDQEAKLAPIPEGERARGTWEGKGKAGEHMLQVRAWRGLVNGGDWVVAWSPDIVDVVK